MGFANSIIGGAAALIRAAIKSPNFVTGSAGWQISKDGSAEFNNLVVRGTFNGVDFVISSNGAFFYSGAPALGNLAVSIVPGTVAVIDPQGNTAQPGIAAYSTVGGDRIAIQLGLGSFAGTPAAGMFTHDQSSPANSDPFAGSLVSSSAGCNAALYSGKSTAGATGSGIECDDSVFSGVAGGLVSVIAGQTAIQGAFSADGGAIASDGIGGLTIGNLFNLTPKMATPPNTAAVKAGTATLAQTEACLGGLIQSMQNRGMVT